MLTKLHSSLEERKKIKIQKTIDGKDVSTHGAFAYGTVIEITVTVPRALGATAIVLRISADGGEAQDIPLQFSSIENACDVYMLSLDTSRLCGDTPYGLFYYEYLFVRGWDTLFSDSINNVDLQLLQHSGCKFRLLVYEKEYDTPAWFRGGTMYHVFADRFYRGEGECALHGDAKIHPDWHHGIPQYSRIAGAPLPNNLFFGGNLWGVAEKLDHLVSLGITVLYLSPIFSAYSNHRYDTGNYETIDSILGGDAAFDHLVKEAHKRGIRIILDGVFNHTGDDSKYFNRRGNYDSVGAYQSKFSPYADWFTFRSFPDSYECWWNIEIMPRLNHENTNCRHYFTADGGIAQKWLLRGADGWRLDVADELSDAFLDELRTTVKKTTNGEGVIIGEVWENAADKIAYGKRRRYFSGRQLDSVMNYPFRNAVLAFLKDRDGETFYNILTELYASYPRASCNALMNIIGTHDTERILTVLGDDTLGENLTNDELAHLRLSYEKRTEAVALLKLASALQFTVFGVPSVYYGDEAGVEGYHDPFCRMPYPWGSEEESLIAHYSALGKLRREHASLKDGEFLFTTVEKEFIAYERVCDNDSLLVLANVGNAYTYTLSGKWKNALTGETVGKSVTVPTCEFLILTK